MQAATGLSSLALIVDPKAILRPEEATAFAAALARRIAREPLSRILGRREFWGLEFQLTPDVLDPRPDTETLVQVALAEIGGRRNEALRILDLGVGSGAILAALLSELPTATGVGVDLSPAAAAVAETNLTALGFADRAKIIVGDFADAPRESFDLIVSNPPYIPTHDLAGLDPEVRNYDPRLALDGGEDGLEAYRRIAPLLVPRSRRATRFAWEVGIGQAEAVADLLRIAGAVDVKATNDLAAIARVVSGAF